MRQLMTAGRYVFSYCPWIVMCVLSGMPTIARAQSQSRVLDIFDEKRALSLGGLSSLEGASGGGIASWATIGGYGSDKGLGTAFHNTYVNVSDYQDQNIGMLLGIRNRIEVSYTHNFFQTRGTGAKLGIGNGYQFDLDIAGIKGRLFGNLADKSWIPQVAVGAMYKHTNDGRVIHRVGGNDTNGADAYVALTKILPGVPVILDTTIRFTKGNQWGILGFGGNRNNNYYPQFVSFRRVTPC